MTAISPNGATDTNYTGTIHFTSTDSHAVLPANYTFTAADAGVHTFAATLETAGTQSVTANRYRNQSTTGTSRISRSWPPRRLADGQPGPPNPDTAGTAA